MAGWVDGWMAGAGAWAELRKDYPSSAPPSSQNQIDPSVLFTVTPVWFPVSVYMSMLKCQVDFWAWTLSLRNVFLNITDRRSHHIEIYRGIKVQCIFLHSANFFITGQIWCLTHVMQTILDVGRLWRRYSARSLRW